MTDHKRGFRTTLSHVGRATKHEHGFVNPPLLRGSTVLVPTVAERQALQARRGERVLTYGTGGAASPSATARRSEIHFGRPPSSTCLLYTSRCV